MAEGTAAAALRHIHRVVGCRSEAGLADAGLLERFAATGDEAAFEVLVWRHGPMVLAVCRRALGSRHDAEDAMQATFLALARQARSITRGRSLGAWLSRVAYRTALRARRQARLYDTEPVPVESLPAAPEPDYLAQQELRLALDEEIQRLPEKYRVPIVLSYLEGLTNLEVARQLGCPIGTVFTRLGRGRALLLARLKGRGVTLPASLVLPALPASLVRTTTLAATAFAAGEMGSAALSPGVVGLAQGVLGMGVAGRLRTAIALGLLLVLAAAGLVAGSGLAGGRVKATARVIGAAAPPVPGDLIGDPLPPGAIVRLGSTRLRHAGLSDYVFLPGSKMALTSGSDRVLRFWDLASGRQVRAVTLQGKAGPGQLVTLSPDGKTLLAVDGGKLVFWEVESGKEIRTLPVPKEQVAYLWFSPDGKTLAVGRSDWRVSLWDWKAGSQREIALAHHPARVIQFTMDSTFHGSFSPDGKWFVASAHAQQPLGIFEVASGREVRRITARASTSTVSPDSKRLAVCSHFNDRGGRETVIRIFDLASGKEIRQYPLGNEHSYFSLAFSPDGKKLACGFSDHSFVMDLASGRSLYQLPDRPYALYFSPDGKTLLASAGQRLRLWDAATGKERHEAPDDIPRRLVTAMSPDGRLLAAGGWLPQFVTLWDTTTGRQLRRLSLKGEQRYVRNLAFSGDGKTLVASQYKGFLQFWDVATGKEKRTLQLDLSSHPNREYVYFYQMHVSRDGKHVATLERMFVRGRRDEVTRLGLWDAGTGKLLHHHLLPAESRRCTWLLDGQALVVPLEGGLALMETATGVVRFRIGEAIGPAVASPDERLLAAPRKAGPGKTALVGVWEPLTGKEVASLAAGRPKHLALAADNRLLVTTDEQHLRVWDLATGKERRRWALPVAVRDLWLAPDSRRAYTALEDGTALVWDLRPGLLASQPLVNDPGKKEIDGWWTDLAGADTARAYAAVWRLAEAGEETVVAFLGKQLRRVGRDESKELRRPIEDLDSDSFEVRERAFKHLEGLGRAAVPALREALEKKPPLEARRRLERLLAQAARSGHSPEVLRCLRSIQVLERIGSRQARQLLTEMASGSAHAPQTQEAKAALQRLSRRDARR
jgi:RNA polymerase sigma factor (sigma-70 family)